MLAVSSGPLPHPILSKLQPGHIDKIIDYTHEEARDSSGHRKEERRMDFALTIFGVVVMVVMVLLLREELELLRWVIGVVLGFIGGAGYAKWKAARADA